MGFTGALAQTASGQNAGASPRQETYEAVIGVAKEHGGGYGLGINYAKTMLGEHASEGAVQAK
jgi:hypothetical protein